MKKLLFSVLALSLCTPDAEAQKLYVRAGIGYAFANGGQTLSTNGVPYSGSIRYTTQGTQTVLSSYSAERMSFNTGIQGALGLGYMFTNNVGIELGANIGIAHLEYDAVISFPSTNYQVTQNVTQYAKNPVVLTPALVIQSGGKKVNIYARAGLALPVKTKIFTEISESSTVEPLNMTARTVNVDEELTCSFNMGFAGAAGIKYPVGKRVKMMIEVNSISLSVYAKKSVWTDYKQNGNTIPLSQIPKDYRETTFSSSNTGNSEPAFSLPFSNMGITAGITYDLQ